MEHNKDDEKGKTSEFKTSRIRRTITTVEMVKQVEMRYSSSASCEAVKWLGMVSYLSVE